MGVPTAIANHWRPLANLTLCIAWLSGCDSAPTIVEEQLLLTPPPDWALVSSGEENNLRFANYAHPTQAGHRLTVETSQQPHLDPLALADVLAQRAQQLCQAPQDFHTFSGNEHGYPTAVRLFACPPDAPSPGNLTMLKIIQGQQVYLVALQSPWQPAEPGSTALQQQQAQLARWALFMRTVQLSPQRG